MDLKKHLTCLIETDRSQSLEFLEEISSTWKKIAEKQKVLKHPTVKLKYLQQLIESLDEYPKKEEFSLNYYLIENAHESIIPFPLSAMLQTLHLDKAKLSEWIRLIEKIIEH